MSWSVAYAIFVNILRAVSDIKVGIPFGWKEYIGGILFNGEIFDINSPAYFVPILFYTEIGYLVLRRFLGKMWNEWIAMIVFTVIGSCVVYHSIKVNSNYHFSSPITMLLKVSFCVQFLQVGVLYKIKLEKWMNKYSSLIYCVFSTVIMWLITQLIGDAGWGLNWLSFNGNWLQINNILCIMPLVTSILGICFWLSISKMLVPSLGNSRLVNFISSHTFEIMMNHILFMAIFNWILVLVNKYFVLPGVDENSALTSSWYRYPLNDGGMYFIYFTVGLLGSLWLSFLIDKAKNIYKHMLCNNK